MANAEHLEKLKQGCKSWNAWRAAQLQHVDPRLAMGLSPQFLPPLPTGHDIEPPDLSGAKLRGAGLDGLDLRGVDLSGADLEGADLRFSNLAGANLRGSFFHRATFDSATLTKAKLEGADLSRADFGHADLVEANLQGANLVGASLVLANLSGADLSGASVYGIAAWDVQVDELTQQKDLRVTHSNEPQVTVDDIQVAQLVHLLIHNPQIGKVLDTIGSRGVLLLGRFSSDRLPVLDALRERLRSLNLVPMVFDFEPGKTKDFTETVLTLAGLSRFIVAYITNPRSVPMELQAIVPNYMVPLVPILQSGYPPFSIFVDLQRKYREWVLDLVEYDDLPQLLAVLEAGVVKPALKRANELLSARAEGIRKRHARDILRDQER